METKRCSKCGYEKSPCQFKQHSSVCRTCRNAYELARHHRVKVLNRKPNTKTKQERDRERYLLKKERTTRLCNECKTIKSYKDFISEGNRRGGTKCLTCRSKQVFEKQCYRCREIKPVSHFSKSSKSTGGYNFQCRVCSAKQNPRSNGTRIFQQILIAEGKKKCTKCTIIKGLDEFKKNNKGHLRGECLACLREIDKQRRVKYPEKIRAWQLQWRQRDGNRERHNLLTKRWRQENYNHKRNYEIKYKQDNKERVIKWKKEWDERLPDAKIKYELTRAGLPTIPELIKIKRVMIQTKREIKNQQSPQK